MLGGRRGVVLVGAALVALAACGGGDDDLGPTATLGSGPVANEAPATTTSTTVDLTVVPAVIDVPYVQAVMDALDGVLHDAAKEAAKDPSLGEAFEARLRSLYTIEEFPSVLEEWEQVVNGIAPQPGRPVTTVLELISATPDCVFFSADRVLAPLLATPLAVVQPYYVKLIPGEPGPFNPTNWTLDLATFYQDGSTPADQCQQ